MSEECYALIDADTFRDDMDQIIEDFFYSTDLEADEEEGFLPRELEIWVAKKKLFPASHYMDISVAVDSMQESAYESVEDACDGWLSNLSKVAVADFYAHIDRWASAHGLQPEFWTALNPKKETIIIENWDGDWKWKEEA